MAATERMGLSTLISLALLVNLNLVKCFNVDINSPIIFSQDPKSLFGYSVAISSGENAVIVGAPKSNDSNIAEAIGKERGAVYKCPITEPPSTTCTLLKKFDNIKKGGIREKQWMGATVYTDHVNVMSCAPRYTEYSAFTGDYYLLGRCDLFNPNIDDKAYDSEHNPCGKIASKLPEFQMCNAGISAKIGQNLVETELYLGAASAQLSAELEEQVKDAVKAFGACEAGFSARTIPQNNENIVVTGVFSSAKEEILYGKIAISENQGRTTKLTSTKDLELGDYMGYAITSGKFKKDKGEVIVGGAPRGDNLGGKVLMYDATSSDYNLFSTSILDPSDPPQTGSYFGAAVAAADINNDGFDDLVVGAPQFANTKPNQGAVYVYLNNKNDGLDFTNQVLSDSPYEDGFFGYSIGSVGDLNDDKMPEIAVGAPWGGEDKQGVVYLYYGTKSKTNPLLLKQTIKPSDIKGGNAMSGFGFSFSEYYSNYDKEKNLYDGNDLDQNKYNDIAIGAFKSGHVAFLKSRPVITIIGSLNVPATEIDLFRSDVDKVCDFEGKKYPCIKKVNVCFSITQSKSPLDVEYTVELDSENEIKRGFMIGEVSTLTNTLKGVTTTEKCSPDFNIYLRNNTKDILRRFGVSLSWKYQEDTCAAGVICPIASKMTALSTFKKIPYIKGCGDDHICQSDLSVKLETDIPGKTIAIGVTQNLTVRAIIKNKGENAFINKLRIVYPPQVEPTSVSIKGIPSGSVEWNPNVSGDSDLKTLGVTLSSPIQMEKEEIVYVQFSVLNLGKGENVTFNATVSTDVTEMNDKDNHYVISLGVSLSANLTVSGSVFPENIKWKTGVTDINRVGHRIKHTFYFQNMGPSSAEESDIIIRFPEKMGNEYILNIIKVDLSPGGIGVQGSIGVCKYGKLNPLSLDLTKQNNTRSRRRRRETTESLSVNCDDGSPNCRLIECKLKRLGKSQSAVVIIESTLVEATFDKLKENRQVVTFARFSSEYVKRPNGAPPDQLNVIMNVNSPYLQVNKQGEPIAWWIILLCILGAILIIGLIVFLLYKKGFFKRKKHGDEGEEDALRKADAEDDFE